MKIEFKNNVTSLKVSEKLLKILDEAVQSSEIQLDEATDLIFSFKDNSYDPEAGGYHPVEIRIMKHTNLWHFDYITDFCFVGSGYCAELVKDVDFDFTNKVCYHLYVGAQPLIDIIDFYELWESNFISYVEMGVFKVKISST